MISQIDREQIFRFLHLRMVWFVFSEFVYINNESCTKKYYHPKWINAKNEYFFFSLTCEQKKNLYIFGNGLFMEMMCLK